jgi:signal transduction histidine kinase
MSDNGGILKWRFDVSTFRLIGRELITDRITALFELVKNCYDANSQSVEVVFENITPVIYKNIDGNDIIGPNPKCKILIKDNGYGMNIDDVRDKWMVIGTSSKRKNPISPAPYNRKCVGEKGIGRFAVDKLGDHVNIITKKINTNEWLNVNIDWTEYQRRQEVDEIILFTDIENRFSFIEGNPQDCGTILEISQIREIWTKEDVLRFSKEASRIVSPYITLTPGFNISITAAELDIRAKPIVPEKISSSTLDLSITFNKQNKTQETLIFNEQKHTINKKEIPIKKFGGISLKIFYFDENARRNYNRIYKGDQNKIDGLKIYRDGIITTPFAEAEADQNKKRDILGIDKRLWQDLFNKVSSREIIGHLDITKDENPLIIDATNRQDFIDNEEYKSLKEFIIEQLTAIEKYKIYRRELRKSNVRIEFEKALQDTDLFTESLKLIIKENPLLEPVLQPAVEQAEKTSSSVKKAEKIYQEAEKEFIRKENIYLSLMSLQQYAANLAHAVRTSLSKVKGGAEFFYKRYPNLLLEDYFIKYSKSIYLEMKTLNKVIDFMLSYAKSDLEFEDLEMNQLIKEILNSNEVTFETEGIETVVEVKDKFVIHCNKQFFIDILQNLIANSVKALKNKPYKIIKCTAYIESDKFVIFFSDNGCGIPVDKRDRVMELYYTTTADEGGAGLGLYIAKTRIESLKGAISIIESEFGDFGTTFKIEFPLKN